MTTRSSDEERRAADPVGARVARNVRALRRARDWSIADLARELADHHWPLSEDALLRIEQHRRRVDVGDLVALALVLRRGLPNPVRVADLLASGPDEPEALGVQVAPDEFYDPESYADLVGVGNREAEFRFELGVALHRLSRAHQELVSSGARTHAEVLKMGTEAEIEARLGKVPAPVPSPGEPLRTQQQQGGTR